MKKISLAAILCCICLLFASCRGNPNTFKLELDKIKNSEEVFCYEGLNWKATAEEAQRVLGLDFGEAEKINSEKDGVVSFEWSLYNIEEISLMKKKGKAQFEFRNDELTSILIHFEGTKKELEPFAKEILDKLVKLYSDKYELNAPEPKQPSAPISKTYDWALALPDGERTSHLQLITLEKGESSIPEYSVNIGILCPNPNPKPIA